MNKRQYKKWKKKYFKKSYQDVRQKIIMDFVNKIYPDEKNGLLYIVDSPKQNLKHPKSIQLFTNIQLVSTETSCDIDEEKEIELEFSCSPAPLSVSDSVAKKLIDNIH